MWLKIAAALSTIPLAFAAVGTASAAPPDDRPPSAAGKGPDDRPTSAGAGKGVASSSDSDKHGTATSGPLTEPQPPSNADATGKGANSGDPCVGPYCSTRDGSASQNGRGGGEAKGKPCAGCVGRADNKNPPGQLPGGSDANKGYECDENQGIGKTNPAHTGCVAPAGPAPTTSPSPSPSPAETESPSPSPSPAETQSPSPSPSPAETQSPSPSPIAGAPTQPGASPSPTETESPSPTPIAGGPTQPGASPSPTPTTASPSPSPSPVSSPTPTAGGRAQPGRLPVTGADTGLLAAGGALVLLLGGLLALIGRRRNA